MFKLIAVLYLLSHVAICGSDGKQFIGHHCQQKSQEKGKTEEEKEEKAKSNQPRVTD